MYDEDDLETIRTAKKRWEGEAPGPVLGKYGVRKERFVTVCNHEVDRLYTPAGVADLNYEEDLDFPGEYSYTRGVYPTMYRGRTWTMR